MRLGGQVSLTPKCIPHCAGNFPSPQIFGHALKRLRSSVYIIYQFQLVTCALWETPITLAKRTQTKETAKTHEIVKILQAMFVPWASFFPQVLGFNNQIEIKRAQTKETIRNYFWRSNSPNLARPLQISKREYSCTKKKPGKTFFINVKKKKLLHKLKKNSQAWRDVFAKQKKKKKKKNNQTWRVLYKLPQGPSPPGKLESTRSQRLDLSLRKILFVFVFIGSQSDHCH